MVTIDELKEWMKEICRWDQFSDFIQIIGEDNCPSEHKISFQFYTNSHMYHIAATERFILKEGGERWLPMGEQESYLGCTASNRKARAGEDWSRGNDLPDGKLCRETWEKIKDGILRYELIALAPPAVSVADDKVVVGPDKEG